MSKQYSFLVAIVLGLVVVGLASLIQLARQQNSADDTASRVEIRPNKTRSARLTGGMMAKLAAPESGYFGRAASNDDTEVSADVDRDFGKPANLPQPSTMSVESFEAILFEFLHERKYQEFGWAVDKSVRDTGPYINHHKYVTHPAVRVYYSPEVMRWLINERKGMIPDGAVIVKEQYAVPAVQHLEKSEDELRASLKSWTVMVKDSEGSHDGWFWANPYPNSKKADRSPSVKSTTEYPFPHPDSGFGHYCIRCHASTQSPGIESPDRNNEFTFSALRNIEGFPGEPIIFRVDDSWRKKKKEEKEIEDNIDPEMEKKLAEGAAKAKTQKVAASSDSSSHPQCTASDFPEQCEWQFNPSIAKLYPQIKALTKADVSQIQHIPPVTHDWVIKGASGGKQELATSNQCMGCHSGLVDSFGPTMFVGLEEKSFYEYRAEGWNVSPYGEWRWSPMGLAGRDPIFFAQLESEQAMLRDEFPSEKAEGISSTLADTCLRCHGAMGKHQFDMDKTNADDKFSVKHVHQIEGKDEHVGTGEGIYGALARDGISCMICHRSKEREKPEGDPRSDLQFYLETSITGNFVLGPPDEVYGPFKDDEIETYSMHHGLGIKPKHSDYIQSSRMCGTCHVVSLPVVDDPFGDHAPDKDQQSLVDGEAVESFKEFHHHVEQATYLEWLNSEFENEYNTDNPNAQSCQDCHMSKGLVDEEHDINIEQLQTRIAIIQDNTYPDAENLTELKNLNIRLREAGYKRHNFVGLNAFLVELFRQFDSILGVRKNDYMTGSSLDIPHAMKNFKRQARNDVVDLDLQTKVDGGLLHATLNVKNKVGHRFPSGVGFRRAFVELKVFEPQEDGSEKVVWASGRTDENGVLVDENGERLPSEFFDIIPNTNQQAYQKHHEVIDSQGQVQIYETLLKTKTTRRFTTSFVRGSHTVKDNRLLPRGWKAEGPSPELNGAYLKATHPGPQAKADPQYTDGSGTDRIDYRIELPDGVDPAKLKVSAAIYYQSIPPYFLKNLFDTAPDGEAVRRLHFMITNANVEGTLIEDWKLLVNSVEASVAQ